MLASPPYHYLVNSNLSQTECSSFRHSVLLFSHFFNLELRQMFASDHYLVKEFAEQVLTPIPLLSTVECVDSTATSLNQLRFILKPGVNVPLMAKDPARLDLCRYRHNPFLTEENKKFAAAFAVFSKVR